MSMAILGVVQNSASGNALWSGLTVGIHEPDTGALLYTGSTGTSGRFSIPVTFEEMVALLKDRHHRTLSFRVYAEPFFLGSQDVIVCAATFYGSETVTLTVDADFQTPAAGCSYAVSGTVSSPDGVGVAGATVKVFNKTLNNETELAQRTADSSGRFIVRYAGPADSHPDRAAMTIVVRAYQGAELIATAGPLYNPTFDQTIRLVVGDLPYRGPSEFDAYLLTLDPLLDGSTYAQLTADNVDYLARKTKLGALSIATLVRAHRLASDTGLSPTIFYGLAHAGFPLATNAILGLPGNVVESTLLAAIEQNVIPAATAALIPAALSALAARRLERAVPAVDPDSTVLGSVLVAAALTPGLPRQFAELYLDHTGTSEAFWAALTAHPDFGPQTVARIQFTLQAGALTGSYAPLIKLLHQKRDNAEFSRAAELAQFSVQEWIGFLGEAVDGGPVDTPAGIPGADPTERRNNYAQAIARVVEDLYPSAHIAYRLPAAITSDVAGFVIANPGFSFRRTDIAAFFPLASGLPGDLQLREQLRQDLLKVQRVAVLAPRFRTTGTVAVLLSNNVVSARQIHRMGFAAFNAKFAEALGDSETVGHVYDAADRVASTALAAFAHIRPEMHFPTMGVFTSPGCGDPELEALFGNLDYCACRHCDSIHGPAAYFVDILQFVRERKAGTGTALDVLTDRRPELVHIKLNCENAETPLPTIDLINEVLERRVRAIVGPEGTTPWPQTTWNESDLLAHPEHLDTGVYTQLRQPSVAYFPWRLPFDLFLAEARVYLTHLGISRSTLQDEFEWWSGIDADQVYRVDERIGLSRGAGKLVRGELDPPELYQLWGFSSAANWLPQINDVERFLKRADIGFSDLQALLRTKILTGVQIVYSEHCTLKGARLKLISDPELDGLDEDKLRRLHAFFRVQRALGWTIHDLDVAMRALDLTFTLPIETDLQALARFVRVRNRFSQIPLGELLTWWAPLELKAAGDGEPSFYEETVRPRLRESVFALDKIVAGDGETTLNAVRGSLLGITRLGEVDLDAAMGALSLGGGALVWLSRLSGLFRIASVARAVGLSASELLTLRNYRQVLKQGLPGPFSGVPDAPVVELLDVAVAVTESRFSVAALDWVLRNERPDLFGASDLDITRVFVGLITALQQVKAEHSATLPPAELTVRERVRALLARVYQGIQLDNALDFIAKIYPDPQADEPAAIGARNQLFPFLVAGSPAYIEFGKDFNLADTETARAGKLEPELAAHLLRRRLEETVIQQMATALSLERADVDVLLREYVHVSEQNQTATALSWLCDDAFFAGASFDSEADAEALKTEGFPALFLVRAGVYERARLYRSLRRVAHVVTTFAFSPGLLRWLLVRAPDAPVDILDLTALPASGADNATVYAAYSGWDWLRRLIRLRDDVLADREGLLPLLEALFPEQGQPSQQAVLDALAAATGWDAQALADFEPNPIPSLDMQSLGAVEALARAFRLGNRLGIEPKTLRAWAASSEVSAAQAAEIKGAAQSKHSPQGWVSIARPIRDRLREQQRDALVDRLLHELTGLQDRHDLFGELLMDVDVNAAGLTSRLVFASAAVQLFMQRALMTLEKNHGVVMSERDEGEWSWMRRYRVWEANRKIFLYPENWVTPELRDDKTPLFKQLEDELSRSEIDEAAAEKAYVHYLEGLNGLSRLEVCGLFHEIERGPLLHQTIVDVLHIFARTAEDPSKIYYRRRVDDAYWTAWEELPFQVEAHDVLPVVANRRLYLIWPKISLKPDDPTGALVNDSKEQQATYRRHVHLMWSELRDESWSSVRTSHAAVRDTTRVFSSLEKANPRDQQVHGDICLTSEFESRDLLITIALVDKEYARYPGMRFRFDACTDQFSVEEFALNAQPAGTNVCLGGEFPVPEDALVRNQAFLVAPENTTFNAVKLPLPDPVSHEYQYSPFILQPQKGNLNPPGVYEIVFPRQERSLNADRPFVVQDKPRRLLVVPDVEMTITSLADASEDTLDPEPVGKVSLTPYLGIAGVHSSVAPHETEIVDDVLEGDDHIAGDYVWLASGKAHRSYRAMVAYHPYTCLFLEQVRRFGVAGLLDPQASVGDASELRYQKLHKEIQQEYYLEEYQQVKKPYPVDDIDFLAGGAYSVYNWELFYHIPMYIADRLIAERRYEDAQRWLGYIFNPMREPTKLDGNECKHYWRIKPFHEAAAKLSITDLLELLHYTGSDSAKIVLREDLEANITAWRENPFRPHLVARTRPTAYMRAVVMKYLDNLIAWGDDLFSQDTHESNNEATQLYILALQLLGRRPRELDAHERPDYTFTQALNANDGFIDDFSNFLVQLENSILGAKDKKAYIVVDAKAQKTQQKLAPNAYQYGYVPPSKPGSLVLSGPEYKFSGTPAPLNPYSLKTSDPDDSNVVTTELYFCIPPNAKLLGYWDTVADRLFKLRNSLNIEGIRRDLPLFEPPIDPALLAKAVAQGLDIATAVSNLHAPLPHYRFIVHLGIAKEFAGQVAALGGALLQALEKRDAEALALLRAGQEVELQAAVRRVRVQAVNDAKENVEALRRSRDVAQKRHDYYSSRERMNALERAEVGLQVAGTVLDVVSTGLILGAGAAGVTPTYNIGGAGIGGSPLATIVWGGSNIASPLKHAGDALNVIAGVTRVAAGMVATQAGYTRRKEEWQFQAELAERDILQIDKQITGAEIRLAIAQLELENHDQQAADSSETFEFMRTKFTNEELYAWMSGELSKLYHHAYRLAIDLARRTERCYRYELAVSDTDFIKFGHWDSRRQGLLAGERLAHDLRLMEAAYYQNNRREYELTKRVSLATLDPVALASLRKSGECFFQLPEVLFDLDHPSHFLRRVKLVSVSLPAVAGPYTDIGVTLTYEGGDIRTEPVAGPPSADPNATVQSVATSTALDDAGLFEPSMRDERYLPFEGKGLANSKWRIQLPSLVRQFDYETISDVILTIRYTAREGGQAFATTVENGLQLALKNLPRAEPEGGQGQMRGFSARAEFPEAWRAFVAAGNDGGATSLELDLSEGRFPYAQVSPGDRKIHSVLVFVRWRDETDGIGALTDAKIEAPDGAQFTLTFNEFKANKPLGRPNYVLLASKATADKTTGAWTLTANGWPIGKAPEDVLLVVQHEVTG